MADATTKDSVICYTQHTKKHTAKASLAPKQLESEKSLSALICCQFEKKIEANFEQVKVLISSTKLKLRSTLISYQYELYII